MGFITINYGSFKSVQSIIKTSNDLIEKYAEVFNTTKLGSLPGTVHLKIDLDVTPVVSPIRRVPVALKRKLKEELDHMEKMQVITPVTHPTDWVSWS